MEGSYVESASERNLNLIAQGAIAGVEYLKTRPEVKTNTIGLTGFNQAGWVIPLAASLGLFNEIPYSPGYHQDYYNTMVEWLKEKYKTSQE